MRAIWALVQRWDLTLFLQRIRARGKRPGRAATDPQLLIALWLYAATEGLGCGRQLARLCTESDPYKWLCGGVSLNYHTLNDFRVDHEEALDDLLTQMIAVLTQAQIVSLCGSLKMVRASRQRRRQQLRGERNSGEALGGSPVHLEAVKQSAADPTLSAQQKAARQRGARERQERLEQALVELKKVEQAKVQQKDKPTKDRPARASSTDPEARFMRMPDGGTRPAYNLELATDCGSRAVVGVETTNAGSDAGQDAPMRDQVEERADEAVEEQLIDGGFVSLEAIDRAAAEETTITCRYPSRGKRGSIATSRSRGIARRLPSGVSGWVRRRRSKCISNGASTIETINGELKTERGLGRLLVRGLRKVQCMALWSALAYNVVHFGPIPLSG